MVGRYLHLEYPPSWLTQFSLSAIPSPSLLYPTAFFLSFSTLVLYHHALYYHHYCTAANSSCIQQFQRCSGGFLPTFLTFFGPIFHSFHSFSRYIYLALSLDLGRCHLTCWTNSTVCRRTFSSIQVLGMVRVVCKDC